MGDKGSSTTTSFDFSPEGKQAMMQELQRFAGQYLPQLRSTQEQGLAALSAPAPTAARAEMPVYRGAASTLAIPAAALTHAGASTALAGEPDLRAAIAHLQDNAPHLLDVIRQAAMGTAMGTTSQIDPRFAALLGPVSTSKTTPGLGSQIMGGVGLAAQAGALASSAGLFR